MFRNPCSVYSKMFATNHHVQQYMAGDTVSIASVPVPESYMQVRISVNVFHFIVVVTLDILGEEI